MRNLEVEVVKLRNLPQGEYDPEPCTSQVRVTLWNEEQTEAISTEQSSSIQSKSNMPYFKDNLLFPLDNDRESGVLCFTVWELSRQETPSILFYGRQSVSLEKYKHRKEVAVVLTTVDPSVDPEEAEKQRLAAEGEALSSAPTLTLMVLMPKKIVIVEDVNADLEISNPDQVVVCGARSLIPSDVKFLWMRFLEEKAFFVAYRKRLVEDWAPRDPLEVEEPVEKPKKRKSLGGKPETKVENVVKTAADVILKRWCCHRPHQVLTRLCLTAEKYLQNSSAELGFTHEEELKFRRSTKERSIIISRMCIESLITTGKNPVRDWMERLWVLYAVGIDNDPAGSRALSFEVKETVKETEFDVLDEIVLRTSLLNFLVPPLSYDKCQALVESDARHAKENPLPEGSPFKQKISIAQKNFTRVLSEFLGTLMDTLTEAEIVSFAQAVKPAVFDAHHRIAKGVKEDIKTRINLSGKVSTPTNLAGINIEHLDKLGNRKKENKFV